ncbi:MAG: glycosyltransferase family 4 protein [Gammaproteobacteria bacterium]|nr:glycosyltransferase family 4 protein [Gammaproteobacteria bacterium]
MKLAIVTGHFSPEVGYQEVCLARAYARLGHEVHVFTSTAVSPNTRGVVKQDYAPGTARDERYGYRVTRLPYRLSFGVNVVSPGLRAAVLAFRPDITIIIGLAKLFPAALLCDELRLHSRLIALFGDAREYAQRGSLAARVRTFLQQLLFIAMKRRLYRRAVRFCDRLVLNHAETLDLYLEQLRPRDRARFDEIVLPLTLGFDPDEFFFDTKDRDATRTKFRIAPQDVVLVTATRVMRGKGLEGIITRVSALARAGLPIRYLIVGFLEDAYAGELRALIAAQPDPGRFIGLPFQDHEAIRRIYCAGDVGIWIKAAISIQEAMGTGLPVVLEDKPVVRHLVRDGENGWFFRPGGLEVRIGDAAGALVAMPPEQRSAARITRAESNRQMLSYDMIAARIVAGLASRQV